VYISLSQPRSWNGVGILGSNAGLNAAWMRSARHKRRLIHATQVLLTVSPRLMMSKPCIDLKIGQHRTVVAFGFFVFFCFESNLFCDLCTQF
jgi:hypothetical protein